MTSNNETRGEFVAGLRAVAALLETTPELPLPEPVKFEWNVWPNTVAEVRAEVARLIRLLPGPFDKNDPNHGSYGSTYATFTSNALGIPLEVCTYREEVCEKVVTGTQTVVETIPDPARMADVPLVEVTRTVENFEWVCRPVLTAEVTA